MKKFIDKWQYFCALRVLYFKIPLASMKCKANVIDTRLGNIWIFYDFAELQVIKFIGSLIISDERFGRLNMKSIFQSLSCSSTYTDLSQCSVSTTCTLNVCSTEYSLRCFSEYKKNQYMLNLNKSIEASAHGFVHLCICTFQVLAMSARMVLFVLLMVTLNKKEDPKCVSMGYGDQFAIMVGLLMVLMQLA